MRYVLMQLPPFFSSWRVELKVSSFSAGPKKAQCAKYPTRRQETREHRYDDVASSVLSFLTVQSDNQ